MKAAPVIRSLRRFDGIQQQLIHTGQHYDNSMSDLFFRQLELPPADINLGVGSGSHARQTAAVMTGLEAYLESSRPDLLMVYGDVNSTMAAAVVAAKMGVPLAHVEAGVRSFDRTMPEEINRLITDRLANVLLTPSSDADENLVREGIEPTAIHCVGNVMIDTIVRSLPSVDVPRARAAAGLSPDEPFALVTLHRPATVDNELIFDALIKALAELSQEITVVFSVHPRTRARIKPEWFATERLRFTEPLGYMEFLALEQHACLVITDSGGVQSETSFLGVPCLTLRDNTEWPITLTEGTNQLIGRDPARLLVAARATIKGAAARGRHTPPEFWDGHAGDRIADVIGEQLGLT